MKRHKERLLDYLIDTGNQLTRAQAARILELDVNSAGRVLRELLNDGQLIRYLDPENARPRYLYQLTPSQPVSER